MHGSSLTIPAPPGATAPPSPPLSPPSFDAGAAPIGGRDLSLALLGLLALGGAAALGLPAGGAALRLTPSVVLVDIAALALTAPALIAVHQFMRLAARPEDLAAALGRALVHGGRVAAGLAVVVLFFSATTNLAIPLLVVSLLGVGLFSSATAWVELHGAERRATADPSPGFSALTCAWLGLSWVIALRVGVDVSAWVIGVPGVGS